MCNAARIWIVALALALGCGATVAPFVSIRHAPLMDQDSNGDANGVAYAAEMLLAPQCLPALRMRPASAPPLAMDNESLERCTLSSTSWFCFCDIIVEQRRCPQHHSAKLGMFPWQVPVTMPFDKLCEDNRLLPTCNADVQVPTPSPTPATDDTQLAASEPVPPPSCTVSTHGPAIAHEPQITIHALAELERLVYEIFDKRAYQFTYANVTQPSRLQVVEFPVMNVHNVAKERGPLHVLEHVWSILSRA